MQLLSYAAQIRARLLPIERCGDVRRCKIRVADDTLRKPVPVGDGLHPFNFGHLIAGRHIDLDINRFDDAMRRHFADQFIDQIIASQRRIVAKNSRQLRPGEPGDFLTRQI